MATLKPLSRDEVIRAVERRGDVPRVPLVRATWWGQGLAKQYGERLDELAARFPGDVAWILDCPVEPQRLGLSWNWEDGGAHDSQVVFDDWSRLDEFQAKLPDPASDPQFAAQRDQAEQARRDDRYLLYGWWRLFFERGWSLRGMQNLMLDYFTAPDQVHRLHQALCDCYCAYVRRAREEFGADGFWTSDDLGHQTGPMMSPDQFREFYLPYYRQLGKTLADCGLHFWLHTCGDVTPLLPDLLDAGVTVLHPVQKNAMDERAVAAEYAGRLTFLAGIDVQHILQEESPEGVRREVRHLVDTFDRPAGGLCLGAGNGIVSGTPLENIEAFLDEAASYGAARRGKGG